MLLLLLANRINHSRYSQMKTNTCYTAKCAEGNAEDAWLRPDHTSSATKSAKFETQRYLVMLCATKKFNHIQFLLPFMSLMFFYTYSLMHKLEKSNVTNSIDFTPVPSRTRDALHTDNSHVRSIVTHRSTKAEALLEQGEPLLQGLRVSDVTDWNATSAHHR